MLLQIGFGGGCHWCTEAVFASLKGVVLVEQGFIASSLPYDNFSEAVIVHYDPKIISLSHLVEIHLHTHSSTSMHIMRKKYRSAVYIFQKDEIAVVENIIVDLQKDFNAPLITLTILFEKFKKSDVRYLAYYLNNKENTFCQRYIHPKLEFLKKHYRDLSKNELDDFSFQSI